MAAARRIRSYNEAISSGYSSPSTNKATGGVASATPPSLVATNTVKLATSFMNEVPQASRPTIGTLMETSAPKLIALARSSS